MRLDIYVYQTAIQWWAGVSWGGNKLFGLEINGSSRAEALDSLSDKLRWLSNRAKEKKIEE
jgi:hypothetical protein